MNEQIPLTPYIYVANAEILCMQRRNDNGVFDDVLVNSMSKVLFW